MSTQAPAPGPPPQSGGAPPQQPGQPTVAYNSTGGGGVVGSIFGLLGMLLVFLYSFGAAKLSYDKYQSIGWAIFNFFFATFYYPYYAIFLSGPSGSTLGGRRRR
jgi:hypothetical protein